VRKFARLDQDPVAAGRELGVDYVLDGHLQMEGEKTRANVRLLRVKDGAAVWSEQCDQSCSTIFELQDAIAQQIAENLTPQLTGEEKQQLAKHYTDNNEAYQLYILGQYYWRKQTKESFEKALYYYEQAIKKDPNYALAYCGAAGIYGERGLKG